jgi:putative flippase GtrA
MRFPVVQRFASHPRAAKITWYTLGSVFALATSVIVFALLYVAWGDTTGCSIVAYIAGAIPNWILNRRWAWRVQGKVNVEREVVGYIVVSAIALAASSAGTAWANHIVKSNFAAGSGVRVFLVTCAYVLVQAVLFVVKDVVYDRWVFAGRSRFRAAFRSRRQVRIAARANRTP